MSDETFTVERAKEKLAELFPYEQVHGSTWEGDLLRAYVTQATDLARLREAAGHPGKFGQITSWVPTSLYEKLAKKHELLQRERAELANEYARLSSGTQISRMVRVMQSLIKGRDRAALDEAREIVAVHHKLAGGGR